MKQIILIVFLGLCNFIGYSQSAKNSDKRLISKKDLKYMPKDLNDCIKQIDKIWDDTMKAKAAAMTETEFCTRHHFGLGLWMRNNWGLWRGARLSKYFDSLGVFHPDDMSGIILASYYRHLKGVDFGLETQIKNCRNYWKVVREPSKKDFPKEASDWVFESAYYYDTKDSGQGCIQVGISKKTGDTWIYDYYLGWLKVSEDQLIILDSIQTRESNLRKLYQDKK